MYREYLLGLCGRDGCVYVVSSDNYFQVSKLQALKLSHALCHTL